MTVLFETDLYVVEVDGDCCEISVYHRCCPPDHQPREILRLSPSESRMLIVDYVDVALRHKSKDARLLGSKLAKILASTSHVELLEKSLSESALIEKIKDLCPRPDIKSKAIVKGVLNLLWKHKQ